MQFTLPEPLPLDQADGPAGGVGVRRVWCSLGSVGAHQAGNGVLRATAERVDPSDAGEIVAVCRRGRKKQTVPILDLPLPIPRPDGAEWIEVYRRFATGS